MPLRERESRGYAPLWDDFRTDFGRRRHLLAEQRRSHHHPVEQPPDLRCPQAPIWALGNSRSSSWVRSWRSSSTRMSPSETPSDNGGGAASRCRRHAMARSPSGSDSTRRDAVQAGMVLSVIPSPAASWPCWVSLVWSAAVVVAPDRRRQQHDLRILEDFHTAPRLRGAVCFMRPRLPRQGHEHLPRFKITQNMRDRMSLARKAEVGSASNAQSVAAGEPRPLRRRRAHAGQLSERTTSTHTSYSAPGTMRSRPSGCAAHFCFACIRHWPRACEPQLHIADRDS